MCSVAYKFGYQGSEKDDEIAGVTGAHYTTFFRELDTRIGRWWAVDPDGDQTPWQSPYCSMDNNPIWLNDPLGDSTNLDDYKLNKISGEITKIRETKDETDKLYAQDENGKLDTKNFITLSKGILDKQINAKPYNKTTSTYMVSSKSEELENLYNFVGTNSDVEWGFGKISNNVSILGTNHSSERVGVRGRVIQPLMKKYSNINLLYYSHSHPQDIDPITLRPAYPSGFNSDLTPNDLKGDRPNFEGFAKEFGGRMPEFFNILVGKQPSMILMYNDKTVIRSTIRAAEVKPKR